MFSYSVVLLAFLGLFTVCHAGPAKKFIIGKTVYEIVDSDKRKLSVGVDENGSTYKALSDADAAAFVKFLEINDKGIKTEDTVDKVPSAAKLQELGGNHEVLVSQLMGKSKIEAEVRPGAVLRLTKKGLDHAMLIGTNFLESYVRSITIPDYETEAEGAKIKISNLKLNNFAMPKLDYQLISPNSLALHSTGGNIAIQGDFNVKKKILFIPSSVSGWFEASISNLGVTIQAQLVANSQGKPQVSSTTCNADIDKLEMKLHGAGIVGWIVNIFHSEIERFLKRSIQDKVCDKVKEFTNEKGNDFLSKLATEIKLKDDLLLDYRLTRNPNIHDPFFDLSLRGETKLNEHDTPFSADALDMQPNENKMASIFFSDYVLNSYLYQLHKAGLSQFHLEKYEDVAKYLSTKCSDDKFPCIGEQIPQLADKYPNTIGQLFVKTITYPSMQFLAGRANLIINISAELSFNNEKAVLFDVHGDFDLISPQIINSSIRAEFAINDFSVTNVQTVAEGLDSVNGQVEQLITMGAPMALGLLNGLGQKGFPLPTWSGLLLQNVETLFTPHTLSVACDIMYSDP